MSEGSSTDDYVPGDDVSTDSEAVSPGNDPVDGSLDAASRSATTYQASIFPDHPLPTELTDVLSKLEAELGLPIWLLLQDGEAPTAANFIDDAIAHAVKHDLDNLPKEPFALVINSPGGDARAAYLLAKMFRRRCDNFVAVVPDAAMSAATILTLGSREIVMGVDAYLGPLDAQIFDHEAESYSSVLNEVRALERLRAYNMESIDETMYLLADRTGKRIDSLMPHVLKFVSDSARPLLEKVDIVHYNERARVLKVGEEYARRLLALDHDPQEAREIATALVQNYPEHGFPIDRDEARKLGIRITKTNESLDSLLETLWPVVQGVTAIGALKEVK